MSASPPVVRRGEYATRGDYHRTPDPDWDYYPTYLAKLEAVRAWLESAGPAERVLDAPRSEIAVKRVPPLWDGHTANRICDALIQHSLIAECGFGNAD